MFGIISGHVWDLFRNCGRHVRTCLGPRRSSAQKMLRNVSKQIKQAIIVPGSGLVKAQAEKEGLDKVFMNAGFEWRDPGCSMCLGMNDDFLQPYERCASTSNRNFQGRQGDKGRTHLVSPSMAAAAAIKGHFYNIVDFINEK